MKELKELFEFFQQKVKYYQGFLGNKQKLLEKLINGGRNFDLLSYIPSSYRERVVVRKLSDIDLAEEMVVHGRIIDAYKKDENKFLSKVNPLFFELELVNGQSIFLVFLAGNERYFRDVLLKLDKMVYVTGRFRKTSIEKFKTVDAIYHPEVYSEMPQLFYPVYDLTAGVLDYNIIKNVDICLEEFDRYTNDNIDYIEKGVIDDLKLPKLRVVFKMLHRAGDLSEYHTAKRRLAFEEVLAMQLAHRFIECKGNKQLKKVVPKGVLMQRAIELLSFSLTQDQESVLAEVVKNQGKEHQITSLLQGDVGSGKTVVSLLAMLNVVEAGFQACIMAPTGILATQHYGTFAKICHKLGIDIEIITGKDTAKQRKQRLENIKSGKAKIVIGTHALFYEGVEFWDLGFIVIDEQHKFGVNQRVSLALKAQNGVMGKTELGCDILLMSATPIPRTMYLALYGNMPVYEIKEKPAGREEIATSVMSSLKIDDLKVSLMEKIASGDKVYWICPLVEESEKLEFISAEERYKDFVSYFGMENVEMAHGKMSEAEREKRIGRFACGEVKILVATTVVEVGVDVPDATIMVVEDAQKFGLSGLHQIRGRVGRGVKKSYCIFVYGTKFGRTAQERLKILKNTNDGFVIADEDLRLRGSGEIFGTRQSGLDMFRFTNIEQDADLVRQANSYAKKLIDIRGGKIEVSENAMMLLQMYNYTVLSE